MGASSWSYWTAYGEGPAAALRDLRARVFRSGDYLGPGGRAWGKPRDLRRRPKTIEALIAAQGENQTHSILDVVHLSVDGGPPRAVKKEWNPLLQMEAFVVVEGGECRVLSDEQLKNAFGTAHPTRPMIEAFDLNQLDELWSVHDSLCFTAWDETKPVELFFVGTSGD